MVVRLEEEVEVVVVAVLVVMVQALLVEMEGLTLQGAGLHKKADMEEMDRQVTERTLI